MQACAIEPEVRYFRTSIFPGSFVPDRWSKGTKTLGTRVGRPKPITATRCASRVWTMASKEVICLLLTCFFANYFAIGSATYCTDNSDCDTILGESCCSDSVCRETCYYCSYDYQCGTGEVCCDGGDCLSVCPIWTGGVIAGAVVGLIVFFGIIISIVACCCCACCPYYRYRSPGTVLVTQPGYQPFVSTTQTTSIAQQQYPPPGYAHPPPPYPSYQQQPGHYPPLAPQAQGQPPIPPPVSAGEPVKY